MTPKTGTQKEKIGSHALKLSLISISAALYVVAIGATAFASTPWGVGHFRPGVVVPAFFAIVFGPIVGGAGAALGCFIGDCFFLVPTGLTTPLLSIVAGVTGNFAGFYLLGWLISKRRSLAAFVLSSSVALVVGNLIAALGVLVYFWFIVPDPRVIPTDLNFGMTLTLGLTFYWFVTMIMFTIPLVPVLIRYVEPTLVRMGIEGVSNIGCDSPMSIITSSTAIALILAGLYALMVFIPEASFLLAEKIPPEAFLLASAIVFASGLVFASLGEKLGTA